jgi:hypothetical protein
MGTTKKYIEEEEKCLLTTSAAREARGNSTIERAWRSAARDTRAALVGANLTDFPEFWWHAMKDSQTKAWVILDKEDKTNSPWKGFTHGTLPNCTAHRPFGCVAYGKEWDPKSKVAMHGKRWLYMGKAEGQPGAILFDGEKCFVPHFSTVPTCFPGLRRRFGRGYEVLKPDFEAPLPGKAGDPVVSFGRRPPAQAPRAAAPAWQPAQPGP